MFAFLKYLLCVVYPDDGQGSEFFQQPGEQEVVIPTSILESGQFLPIGEQDGFPPNHDDEAVVPDDHQQDWGQFIVIDEDNNDPSEEEQHPGEVIAIDEDAHAPPEEEQVNDPPPIAAAIPETLPMWDGG